MSQENLRAIIQQLNRLDVDKAGYEYIVSVIRKLIKGARIYIGMTRSTDLYFRAVVWSKKPQKVSSLGAPPLEYVKGFQRCNPPNIPMFYSSSKRITALLERNVQEGDTVYLSQWVNKEPVPANRILAREISFESNMVLNHRENIFYTYVDTIFTRPVHETFSNAYKFTSAVTQVLTTGFTKLPDHDVREDGTVGFMYPSITDIEDSYNAVFHAGFAEQRLQLVHVMELTVKKRDGKKISIEVSDNAIEFPNGKIAWLNNPFAIPKLREDLNNLMFISNGREWVIPIREESHTPVEIERLLNESANKDWL